MPPPTPEPKGPTLTNAPPTGRKFPCAECGARLDFDPTARSLKCPYCGHVEQIQPDNAKVEDRDYEEYLRKLAGQRTTIAGRSSQVRCTGCGAVVLLEDQVVTERCPFCATHLENKPEAAQDMIAPESLLPFKIDERGARAAFDRWVAGRWFAPNSFKKMANLGQVNGVYLPFWTYDAMTYTHYTGQRGVDYTETETYTETNAQGESETKTRTVVKTMWFPVSGEVQHFFDDVLVCASKSLPKNRVAALAPWDLGALTGFKAEYLSGFKTERYAVGLKDGFDEAKSIMSRTIEELCRQDIGGDHQIVDSMRTQHVGVTFKHLLLPLWLASYRYFDKLYHILVNARTGAVTGDRPWSWWKIGLLVLLIMAIAGVLIYLTAMHK
ncbi:MAG: hypothetical protein ACJ8F7_16920 [Gemmataceae bacterium]